MTQFWHTTIPNCINSGHALLIGHHGYCNTQKMFLKTVMVITLVAGTSRRVHGRISSYSTCDTATTMHSTSLIYQAVMLHRSVQ